MRSTTGRRRRGLRGRRGGVAALVAAVMLVGATASVADDYDPTQSAHPLRLVAYLLHPVGVFLDYVLVRPAHWLVSQEPFDKVFGHDD